MSEGKAKHDSIGDSLFTYAKSFILAKLCLFEDEAALSWKTEYIAKIFIDLWKNQHCSQDDWCSQLLSYADL